MKTNILSLLKENNVKITNERMSIIDILQNTEIPLSIADIFLRVKAHLPKANLTTIYRNLEMLENLSIVKRLGFNKNYFSYELISNREHHHHLICRNCARVEDLQSISENFMKEISKKINFRIEDHNLEFFGLCWECQKHNSLKRDKALRKLYES